MGAVDGQPANPRHNHFFASTSQPVSEVGPPPSRYHTPKSPTSLADDPDQSAEANPGRSEDHIALELAMAESAAETAS
eukprot:15442306-Alexandrium_andersonii.AAC.1